MQTSLKKHVQLLLIAISAFLVLWVASQWLQPTPSAYAELPPRPVATPTAVVPESVPVQTDGAQIKLVVPDAVGTEWAAVQWQDPHTGHWTTVAGWQGTLDENGRQTWWVGKAQFGQGPFRWLLFDHKEGTLLGTSSDFNLPAQDRQIILITLSASKVK